MKYKNFNIMLHCGKCKEELKNHDWDEVDGQYVLTKFGTNCNYPAVPFEDQGCLDIEETTYAEVSCLTQLCVLCGGEVGQFNDGLHITKECTFVNGKWVCRDCFEEMKLESNWKKDGYYSP